MGTGILSSCSKDNLLGASFLDVVERMCGELEDWVVRYSIGQYELALESLGGHWVLLFILWFL